MYLFPVAVLMGSPADGVPISGTPLLDSQLGALSPPEPLPPPPPSLPSPPSQPAPSPLFSPASKLYCVAVMPLPPPHGGLSSMSATAPSARGGSKYSGV